MEEIQHFTEIFNFRLWYHKFICLETFFGFKICQLKLPLITWCLVHKISSYPLKVNNHRWSEIRLINLFFVSWFDKIIFFNLLSYRLSKFVNKIFSFILFTHLLHFTLCVIYFFLILRILFVFFFFFRLNFILRTNKYLFSLNRNKIAFMWIIVLINFSLIKSLIFFSI